MEETDKPNVNFIPCLKWVKRGVAKANPDKIELNEEELAKVLAEAKSKIKENIDNSDSDNEMVDDEKTGNTEDEFKLNDYDDEDDRPDELLSIGNVASFSNEGVNKIDHYSDSESERDDDIIKPTDNLILVGHVEGDSSTLEIYVYNEEEGSLYVHHDILLPSFPLCIEWLDLDPSDSKPGNLCAIGTMSPVIEVWDLDIVDCLESAYSLGRVPKSKKKKARHSLGTTKERFGHTDAVLDLAWNHYYEHILASGSVDKTVILWDLHAGKPSIDLKVFKDKVQTLQWHPFEASTLLVGSCDKNTRVFDCRIEQAGKNFKTWEHGGEIECVRWNPHEPFYYLTGTSEGMMSCIDVRNEEPVWMIQAHEKEITGLGVSQQCPGLVVTCSSDESMAIWDIYGGRNEEEVVTDSSKYQPVKVYETDLKMGGMQCLAACPESPFKIAFGGDNRENNFKVLDLMTRDGFMNCFSKRKLVEHKVATEDEPENDETNEDNAEEWETDEEEEDETEN